MLRFLDASLTCILQTPLIAVCADEPAALKRCENFSRDNTSSNSANKVALLHDSKVCALTPSSRRRGGPPGEMIPETSVFVSSTTRTIRRAARCGPGVPLESQPRSPHRRVAAGPKHRA
jgi:hypothetical protein